MVDKTFLKIGLFYSFGLELAPIVLEYYFFFFGLKLGTFVSVFQKRETRLRVSLCFINTATVRHHGEEKQSCRQHKAVVGTKSMQTSSERTQLSQNTVIPPMKAGATAAIKKCDTVLVPSQSGAAPHRRYLHTIARY